MPGFHGARRDNRDYNTAHTKARAQAFARLPEYSPCCRCGKPMWKWAKDRHGKSALHYDHNNSRTGYLGFAHADCNRRAGAAQGGRVALARRWRRSGWQSRQW